MTAINLCADSRRAYLATDSGYFDPATGRIVALMPKAIAIPTAQLAIGFSGATTPAHLAEHLEAACHDGSQRGILRALPLAVRSMADDMRTLNPEGHVAGWNTVRLWIASYDRVRAKPRLYTIASDPDPSMPAAAAGELREVKGWATGLTPAQVTAALPRGYIADSRADMPRLFDAQRRYAMPHIGGRCGVAGDCTLYTVTRRGVEVETVASYPEGVGDVPRVD